MHISKVYELKVQPEKTRNNLVAYFTQIYKYLGLIILSKIILLDCGEVADGILQFAMAPRRAWRGSRKELRVAEHSP